MTPIKASIKVDQTSPTFGSQITVTFDPGPHVDRDNCGVDLIVNQNGQTVLTGGGYPVTDTRIGGSVYPFLLGPTAKWTSGAAQGRVELFDESQNRKVIAHQDFSIGA